MSSGLPVVDVARIVFSVLYYIHYSDNCRHVELLPCDQYHLEAESHLPATVDNVVDPA